MFVRSLIALTFVALLAPVASADQYLTFSESFNGSGTADVGGTTYNFTNQVITLSATVDTTTTAAPVDQGNLYSLSFSSIVVTVAGLGSDTAYGSFAVQSSTDSGSTSYAGFVDTGSNIVLAATEGSAFNSYALFSPISAGGSMSLYSTVTLPYTFTNNGPNVDSITVQTVTSTSSNFTAALLTVPEPSSIAMTAIAGLIGGVGCWRRRRAQSAR